MPVPTPAEESVGLFNDIVMSEPDEQKKLAPLVWRARKLCKIIPSDFGTRVALASVLLQTGNRADALIELDTAYGLRQIDDLSGWQHLAHLFTCVLDYERAGDLIRATTTQEVVRQVKSVMENAIRFAICSGDVDYLRELSSTFDDKDPLFSASLVLAELNDGNLAEHLPTHQRIVSDLLDGIQSWIGVAPIYASGDPLMIVIRRYFQHGKADRLALRRKITDALGDYYRGQGMAPGHYMSRLHTALIEIPEPAGAAIAA